MVSTGYNISDEDTDTCSLSLALSDKPATDPLLKPLANNGGLTETHALPSVLIGDPATSPAIDSADNLRCPNNDQRGSLRPDDGNGNGNYDCDVGAFELFIPRADLHINNVTAPDIVAKNAPFNVVVEVHNDDANSAVPGVQYAATLNSLTGVDIASATPSTGSCGVPAHTVTCTLGDMEIGATETILLKLTGGAQGDYALESVVQAQAGVLDPVPGNNSVLTHFSVLGISDIALTAEPLPAVIDQGDVVSLMYTVTNNGQDAATTARLGLPVPVGASFVSASASKGSCAHGGGEVLCTIGALAFSESATVEIQLSVNVAGALQFSAAAAADQIDPDDSNNFAGLEVTAIANADLRISGSAPSSTTVRQQFSVTVSLSNAGPQDATNVLATITLPTLVDFVSADGCVLNGNVLECAAAALASGESLAFTLRFNTDTTGTATINASVVGDQTDPDGTNNSATLSVAINNPPSSGGGCVYNPDAPADPTLPAMLLFALLMLGWRRRITA